MPTVVHVAPHRERKRKIELLGELYLRLKGVKRIWAEEDWDYHPWMWARDIEAGIEVLQEMVEQGILTREEAEPVLRILRECVEVGDKQWMRKIGYLEAQREMRRLVDKALEMLERLFWPRGV